MHCAVALAVLNEIVRRAPTIPILKKWKYGQFNELSHLLGKLTLKSLRIKFFSSESIGSHAQITSQKVGTMRLRA